MRKKKHSVKSEALVYLPFFFLFQLNTTDEAFSFHVLGAFVVSPSVTVNHSLQSLFGHLHLS